MDDRTVRLEIEPAVSELGIVVKTLEATRLRNKSSDAEFEKLKRERCKQLQETYTEDFVKSDPVLEGFRELRRKIGRSSRRYPTSIDGLIRFLHRTGGMPSINLAVDIYNLVSLETRLTLGAHDVDRLTGNINLRFVSGNEHFVPLGKTEPEKIPLGEYAYIDDDAEVLCRMDYKQADKTKITAESTHCFFIIQGNGNTTVQYVNSAVTRLADLLTKYCEGGDSSLRFCF